MLSPFASPTGTASLRQRFPLLARNDFYRTAQSLTLSSLGLGTYLGAMDDETDRTYALAVRAAVRQGINVIDTALNYRHQRSERVIGRALESLFQNDEAHRSELLICSKAGYLVPKAVPAELLAPDDIVGKVHCLAPAFLADQLERSLLNLRIKRLDVFYLHNPETQLQFLSHDAFYERVRLAFTACEQFVAEGKISFYGMATWDGFRRHSAGPDSLQLARLVALARQVGGAKHHFRFIQLPFNLSMPEAITARNQTEDALPPAPLVEVAHRHGISVIGSASLLQGGLAEELPDSFLAKFTDSLPTQAQRALQFARSTPGLTSSLVGMSKADHVTENMAVAKVKPFRDTEYYSFFTR